MDIHEADFILAEAERRIHLAQHVLVESARRLAERMTKVADRLEREGASASINALGEVQEQGLNVDRACALFCEAREAHKTIQRAVRAARAER